MSDHRSGYAIKSHNFEESYRIHYSKEDVTLYPISLRENMDIKAAL